MTATYKHDYEAFGRLVECAPWMLAHLMGRGAKVLARAEITAPYDPNDPDLVHYRDHFELTGGIRVAKTRRAYARVSNTDMPTALFVEFGTVNNPRHRTLGNALDAAGD